MKHLKTYEAFTREMPKENPNRIEQQNKHLPGNRSDKNNFGTSDESETEIDSEQSKNQNKQPNPNTENLDPK